MPLIFCFVASYLSLVHSILLLHFSPLKRLVFCIIFPSGTGGSLLSPGARHGVGVASDPGADRRQVVCVIMCVFLSHGVMTNCCYIFRSSRRFLICKSPESLDITGFVAILELFVKLMFTEQIIYNTPSFMASCVDILHDFQ